MHWNSSRAPRRPHSREQGELMALDVAFRSLKNMLNPVNNVLVRSISVVAYIYCDTLWTDLVNETVLNIPEIGYRCCKAITTSHIHLMYLLPDSINPEYGTIKARQNKILDE